MSCTRQRGANWQGQQGRKAMIGWAFRQLVGWLAVVAVIAVVIANRGAISPTQPSAGAARPVEATSLAATAQSGAAAGNSLVFQAGKNGYVTLDVAVNGTPLRMVVDTGASSV